MQAAKRFLDELNLDTRVGSEADAKRGPREGNLENPNLHSERRRTPFDGERDENGILRLHGWKDKARVGLQKELPWARMAAMLILANRTNEEIAQAANVTKSEVSILRSQLWFQELLATLAQEEGESYQALMRAEVVKSIQKVVELRDYSESDRVQLAAAQLIIEQVEGKAVQKVLAITSTVKTPEGSTPEEQMANIQSELSTLRNARAGRTADAQKVSQESCDSSSGLSANSV